MPSPHPPINPYAPTVATGSPLDLESLRADESQQEPEPLTLRRTAIRWFTVCVISALPSFFFGISITGGQIGGMVLGILIFAVGYTILDYQTALTRIRRKKSVRRTLRIMYGTRVTISLIFPVGMYLDLMCGLASVGLVSAVLGQEFMASDSMSFGVSLLTTLVQGSVLNVVLGVFGLLVHLIQLVVIAVRR